MSGISDFIKLPVGVWPAERSVLTSSISERLRDYAVKASLGSYGAYALDGSRIRSHEQAVNAPIIRTDSFACRYTSPLLHSVARAF